MIFTVLFNALLIFVCLLINLEFNASFEWVIGSIGGYFARDNYHMLIDAPLETQQAFCPKYIQQIEKQITFSNVLYFLLIFNVVCTASSLLQKIAVVKSKDNVDINFMILALELSFIFVGISYVQLYNMSEVSTITTDVCGKF